jgi:actin-related protein
LHFPIERGVIEDFDIIEKMWNYIVDKELCIGKNMDILITECPLNTKQNRIKLAEILFEKLNVQLSQVYVNRSILWQSSILLCYPCSQPEKPED